MGAGASAGVNLADIPDTVDEAKAKELAGDRWDQAKWDAAEKNEDGTISKETMVALATAGATAATSDAAAAPAADAAAEAPAASADGVDRSDIERNANGSEEPSSADPELWNVDGTEVDYLVKYKVGGQMWYVQSRMRENPPKGMPIPGFPMNQKAKDAKRYYKVEGDDGKETEFNTENDPATHWKKEWQVPPASS
jgi:hypothetical protein